MVMVRPRAHWAKAVGGVSGCEGGGVVGVKCRMVRGRWVAEEGETHFQSPLRISSARSCSRGL